MPARVDDAPARRSCRPSSRALRRPGGPDPLLPASTSSKRLHPDVADPVFWRSSRSCKSTTRAVSPSSTSAATFRRATERASSSQSSNARTRPRRRPQGHQRPETLLAKRMGKTRLIAETGAGQHGGATAMAVALTSLDCAMSWTEEPAPWRMEASRPGSADAPSQPPPPIWSLHDRVLLSMP